MQTQSKRRNKLKINRKQHTDKETVELLAGREKKIQKNDSGKEKEKERIAEQEEVEEERMNSS